MARYLIAETTREEREKIVAESLGILRQTAMAVWPDWQKCTRITLTVKKNSARSIWNLTQDM